MTDDDEDDLVAAADAAAAIEDPTSTEVLVAQRLLEEGGPFTAAEAAESMPFSKHAAHNSLRSLVDAGLAEKSERVTPSRGRNPKTYAASRALRTAAGQAAEPDVDVRREIVEFLARSHYRRRLSSQPCRRIALDVPGANSKQVAAELRRMEEDGVVEQANGDSGSTTQWRLRDVTDVAPFRA